MLAVLRKNKEQGERTQQILLLPAAVGLSNLWFQQMETEQIIFCSKSKTLRFESAVKGT